MFVEGDMDAAIERVESLAGRWLSAVSACP